MSDTPRTDAVWEACNERDGDGWKFARELEREAFALAASQCSHPVFDERGHQFCGKVEATEQRLRVAGTALKRLRMLVESGSGSKADLLEGVDVALGFFPKEQ